MKPRTALAAVALSIALALPGALAAQEGRSVQVTDSTATFDFQQAELQVVLGALAEIAGLTVTYGPLPDRRVTLRTGEPIRIADVRAMLESVARANGVRLVEEGALVRLESVEPIEPAATPAQAAARGRQTVAQQPDTLHRRLFVHSLRHVTAERIVATVGALFGIQGADAYSDASLSRNSLSEMLQDQREAPFRTEEFPVSGGMGGGRGGAVGLTQPVDMVPDPLTNSVLVLATPADYAVIQEAIQQLDVRPLQVLIEVLIAEVRHNEIGDLGIDVDIPLEEGAESGTSFRLSGVSAGDVALQILGIGGTDADVVLRALASKADVRVVSRPVVLAQNNREARILVGDQRPFIQMFRALPTEAAVRDQVVQYRDVGTQLTIKPTINVDGYVNLSIVQEVSNATSETQFGAPVINTREVESELMVRDGQTVVLGGLVDHLEQKSESGIPLLKDIPLLGNLFKSQSNTSIANELLLMVTPHVIRTDEDLENMSRSLRGAMPALNKELNRRSQAFDSLFVRPDTSMAADTIPAAGGAAQGARR